MSETDDIPGKKQGRRPHFLQAWMEKRGGLRAADLVRDLGVDKSLVSRWLDEEKQATPGPEWIGRLEKYFETSRDGLFRHPDEGWFAGFFAGRDQEEIDRIKATVETAFPKKPRT